jgi:hypothetical protein
MILTCMEFMHVLLQPCMWNSAESLPRVDHFWPTEHSNLQNEAIKSFKKIEFVFLNPVEL